ncbi:peptide deformylase [Microbacterium aoyamense]|uniref:Peptide deformylase n=1 Tax=Microbacterium aoyamense TaxID=344166 RepID=A0ABP5B7C6_9MICO|nr:peptide deformylase [Microbacterium aoyamense]
MAVRPIRVFGDPVLRSACAHVGTIDEGTRALVQDLIDTVELPGRAGVAANQIGVGVRVFSYNIDGDIGYLINPELVEVSGEPEAIGEGCLSVPGLWHDTVRYPRATARGIDLDGNEVVLEGEGLLAQALQHEIDHLDGKLYIDRLTPETRRIAMREIRESSWF